MTKRRILWVALGRLAATPFACYLWAKAEGQVCEYTACFVSHLDGLPSDQRVATRAVLESDEDPDVRHLAADVLKRIERSPR
jgi:hypothetical protein